MEEWRDIIGFEGLYQVSNLGRVKSLVNNHGQARVQKLKSYLTRYGYLVINLYKSGKNKVCRVHRLVAEAFLPNPLGLPEVNHKDEDKTNNQADNLEWCTRKYNMNYGTGHQRSAEKQINHPILSKRVYQYTKSGAFVQSYPSMKEAERQMGISTACISNCCNGKPKYKSAGGYRWSYDPPTPTQTRVLF